MRQPIAVVGAGADDARIEAVFGAPRPRAIVDVVPRLAAVTAAPRAPAPPFYFVVDLDAPVPVSRDDVFGRFTNEWLQASGEPVLFCGRKADGKVETLGRPGRPPPFGRTPSPYDQAYLALSWEASKPARRPRAAEEFERVVEHAKRVAAAWSPRARVSPAESAAAGKRLAEAKALLADPWEFFLRASGEGYDGKEIWRTLHELGLVWSDVDAFWWLDQAERIVSLSVGTTTPPGHFRPEEMASGKRYADLRFGTLLGKHAESLAIVRAMICFGTAIQARIGGNLETADGRPFDPEAFVARADEALARVAALHVDATGL